jgi:two-component system probable response regulator PhcQ
MTTLFIVDDEPSILNALRRMLLNPDAPPALPNLHVNVFTSPTAALAEMAVRHIDVVISDYRMPEMDGVTLLTRMKELQPDAGRIMLSACTDMDGIVRAVNQAGIFRFVNKPWSDAELKSTVAQVLAERDLLAENRRLADELRCQRSVISRQQAELARLEAEVPGITRVRWSEDGGVLLEE